MAAMIGVATLVPPAAFQPGQIPAAGAPTESYTATGVPGSATAATSVSVRFRQAPGVVPACQAGLGSIDEQPDPVPLHAVWVPRWVAVAPISVVPPTAVTNCHPARYWVP